jgi:hypothetical protein
VRTLLVERLEDRRLLTAPVITGISPASGPAAGGTQVTISGTGLGSNEEVFFGTTPANGLYSYSLINHTLTVTSPPGTGIVDVIVDSPSGEPSSPTPADRFTYLEGAPTVNEVSPALGPTAGGTTVTIAGKNFTGASQVDFGSAPATNFVVKSDTQIAAITPGGAAGPVDVTVVTPSGTSATSAVDQFTYAAVPVVTGISPATGPTAGGTAVTIAGTGFTRATKVSIGSVAATSFTVDSDAQITATTGPTGAAGAVDVTVVTPGGTSATSAADRFTYTLGPPVVTGLAPVAGPMTGGTAVTIAGSGFTGAIAVDFGTAAASSVVVDSDLQITATSPPGAAGAADVTVVTPRGTSAVSSADQFTYVTPPVVTGVSPAAGFASGGTTVTIAGTGFTGATQVDFGTTPAANVMVDSDSQITATSPPGAGTADVTVVATGGPSPISADDGFSYLVPPASALTASDGTAGSGFGASVAISGNTLVVGVQSGALTGSPAGAVYVFTASGTSWNQVAELKASDGAAGNRFGASVAISGNAIVVGAPSATVGTHGDQGEAYVFTGSGANWTQAPPLTASDGVADDFFGSAVAISGNTIAVGAEDATATGTLGLPGPGAAYVFTGSGSKWSQAARLAASNGAAGQEFGASVAIQDGTVVVGASGTAYVFSEPSTGWTNMTQSDTLQPTDNGASAAFGFPVALDGATIAVGAPSATTSGMAEGAVYLFTPKSILPGVSVWVQAARLTVPGARVFGGSIAIQGNTLLVGERTPSVGSGGTPGAADVFTGAGSAWTQSAALTATFPGVGDGFGASLAIGGTTMVAGAPGANSGQGTAYVIGTPSRVTAIGPATGPSSGGTTVTLTGSGFTGVTGVSFGAAAATSFTVDSDTQVRATSPAGTGTVSVTVIKPGGTSPTSAVSQFTYAAAPSVTGIGPATGPGTGATSVMITGSGFTGATQVSFGSIPAIYLVIDSDTQLTATSPPGTLGPVDVTVVAPGGTSATSPADRFTYLAVPAVTGISPVSGPTAGGTRVTIIGTGFSGPAQVVFGTTLATSVVVNSATEITATSPAGTGAVDVTVITPGGTSAVTAADQFTYGLAPAVTGVSPASGPAGGGTTVTIAGRGFTGATRVNFGTAAATNVAIDSDTQITATSPAGAGTVDVTVINPAGTSLTSAADQFTYGSVPAVTGVSPASGPAGGGTTVTIAGRGFSGATRVNFGTAAATNVVIDSGTQITVISPPGAGTVDVTVLTSSGTSGISSNDQFHYAPAPTVIGTSPASGSAAGGSAVTIAGSGFTAATQVIFGAVAATNIVVNSDLQITATSPAGPPGAVDVTVVTPNGTSSTTPADRFTYLAAPTVTRITSTVGPAAGGTPVTITGSGFNSAALVYFGTTLASDVVINSDAQISATSPPGTGTVDVTVVTPAGASAISPAVQFNYVVAPAVTALSRTTGRLAGGTPLTITGSGFNTAALVYFGTTLASQVVITSATQITATSPPGAVGPVDVTVAIPGGTSGLTADDRFTYVPAPAVSELTASDSAANAGFGSRIAIDGNTLVVGAPSANSAQGEVYVFTKSNTGWTQSAILTAPAADAAAKSYFGSSVAISGSTIVAGARGITIGLNGNQGAAYVFTDSGSSWTEAARLTASDGAQGDRFGQAVGIRGSTIAVGAPYQNVATGAVYVFSGSGSSWTQEAKLLATDGSVTSYFGNQLSVSGSAVAVASLDAGPNGEGAAYLFTSSGSGWSQAAEFNPPSAAGSGSEFGVAVAVSGNTVLVGAPGATVGDNRGQGVVYAYTQSGSAWPQTGTLTALDGQSYGAGADGTQTAGFGDAVALDGSTAAVGEPNATVDTIVTQGAAYTFTQSGFDWSQSAKVTAPDGVSGDGFGGALAISGTTYAIGASSANNASGKVYVGPWPEASVTGLQPASGPAAGGTTVTITGKGFTAATQVDFGTYAASRVTIVSDTELTATSPAGAGLVDVTVTTPGGVSAAVASDKFTYIPVPTVTGLSVPDGLPAGGTRVTIRGANLDGATAVMFGGAAGTIVSDNYAQVVVMSPAGDTGVVDITVTTPGGASAVTSADRFTYTPLAITSASSTVFKIGQPGSFALTTGAANPTFGETGALPSGVTFSAAGVFSGTPAAGTVGIYPVVITATDGSSPPATQAFTLMVATTQGTVYWLNRGWLDMRASGSNDTLVIDTNVAKLGEDGSGSAVVLEESGHLVRFAPNAATPQAMLTSDSSYAGYSNYLIDGSGSVVAFEPKGGTNTGALVRFAAGTTVPQPLSGTFSSFAEDGSGSVVALDTNKNLWLFGPGATTGQVIAGGVGSFVVDGAGSVVAFVPGTGTLVRFAPGTTNPEPIPGTYQSYAEDGKGDVVVLDTSDPKYHLDTLWLLGLDSTVPRQMATGVGTFQVDIGGSVVAFESTQGASTGTLVRFAPGTTAPAATLDVLVKQFELDGSGQIVCLDASGNLLRFGPGDSTAQTMATGVTRFAVDGAGYVVAEVPFTFLPGTYNLVQFAPGAILGFAFVGEVKDFQVDNEGAVVALDSNGDLSRYAPGSTTAQSIEGPVWDGPNAYVQSFAIDGAGQIVALEGDGTLVRFVAGTKAGTFTREVMIAATPFSSSVTSGSIVSAFHVDPKGVVVAQVLHILNYNTATHSYQYGYNASQLLYFMPGSNQPNPIAFNFQSSWQGDAANGAAVNVNNVWVLAGGTMVVAIGADSQGYFGGQDYEVYAVAPGTYGTTAANPQLYIQTVNVSADGTSATPVVNQSILQQYQDSQNHHSFFDTLLSVFVDILVVAAGVVISVLSDGILAPAVAGAVEAVGIGAGAVADAIGLACAAAIGSAVTQGIDDAITGKSGFSWTAVLTAGLTAVDGSDLIGELGDLGSVVDAGDDSLIGQVLGDTITTAATSFVTGLASSGSIDSALGQALQGGLGALTGDVTDELGSSLMSSTFLQDTSSFLSEVSGVVSDLPFANDALAFLNQAVGGDWSNLSFATFAESGASFLDQLVPDGLAGTPFGDYVTSLLDQTVAGGLTGSSFAQGALSFLENAASDALTGSDLVQNLGSFLDQVGQAGSSFSSADFGSLLDSTLGGGLGSFFQQAVSGGLTTSTLAQGLGDFLQQAVGSDPSLDAQSLANGLGSFLQQAVGDKLGLDSSTLADGLGTFLQQAVGPNLNLDTSSLATGIGDFLQQAVGSNVGLDTSPLAAGLGDFLQQAVGANLGLDTSTLATGLGDFLQQAAQDGASFLGSTAANDLGTFLQQAAQDGASFVNSTLGNDFGTFLQQAAQDGNDFLNSSFLTDGNAFLQQAAQDATDFVNSTGAGDLAAFLQQAAQAGTSFVTSTFGADAGTFLQQAGQDGVDFLNSALGTGAGALLQQATQASADFLGSAPAAALGAFLQDAAQGGFAFANSGIGRDAGSFLQQAAQNGVTFLNSPLVTGIADVLQQAAQDGTGLLDALGAGQLGPFVALAAQGGASYAGTALATGAGSFLEQAAADGANYLESTFFQNVASFLSIGTGTTFASSAFAQGAGAFLQQAGQQAASFAGSPFAVDAASFLDQALGDGKTTVGLAQDSLTYLTQALSEGAAGSDFAKQVLPFFDKVIQLGYSGPAFLQDLGSLVTQLDADGLQDPADLLPGVNVTNANLLTALGNASIAQGDTAAGQAALDLAAQLHAVTAGPVSLSQSYVAVSASSVTYGSQVTVTLVARDAAGIQEPTGGLTVQIGLAGSASGGTFGSVTDHNNGKYSATFTATAVGGPYILKATIGGNPLTSSLPTVKVTPAPLTIAADDQVTVLGAPLPPLTVSYSGFVYTDNAGTLTTPPVVTTTARDTSTLGTFAIAAAGAADVNYTIQYVAGVLTVETAGGPSLLVRDVNTGDIAEISGGLKHYVAYTLWVALNRPAAINIDHNTYDGLPQGAEYAPEGMYVRDATTGEIDELADGLRHYVFYQIWAAQGSPTPVSLDHVTFAAIPQGGTYAPDGMYVRDLATGEIDRLGGGLRHYVEYPIWAAQGSPAPVDLDDFPFQAISQGGVYAPDGLYVQEASSNEIDELGSGLRHYVFYQIWAAQGFPAPVVLDHNAFAAFPQGGTYAPDGMYVRDLATGEIDALGGGQRHYVYYSLWAAQRFPEFVNLDDFPFQAIPQGGTFAPEGKFVQDSTTGEIDALSGGQRHDVSYAFWAGQDFPSFLTIDPTAFAAIPQGNPYVPNGLYVQDTATGEIDYLLGGQRHYVSYQFWAAQNFPEYVGLDSATFTAIAQGNPYPEDD